MHGKNRVELLLTFHVDARAGMEVALVHLAYAKNINFFRSGTIVVSHLAGET